MPTLRAALLGWYAREGRELPWRKTRDPYAIWLSEIMLQQTRVETVIPYWTRFLAAYPTVGALADAPLDGVLSQWSGLGYYRRARMLHQAAREVAHERAGMFPETAEGLAEIAGIGRYTAGAIASIAFGRPAALVDGNVARVLARIFAVEDDVRGAKGLARVWGLAEALVPESDAGSWNQALMDLGATTCVPRQPRCPGCPARDLCDARAQGKEDVLPVLAPKAKPRRLVRAALVARRGAKVLLGRLPPTGTFGGLWEPPSLDSNGTGLADLGARFEALTGSRLEHVTALGRVTHVLSHRRLEIDVVGATIVRGPTRLAKANEAYEALELVDPRGLALRGLATLARKVLAVAKVE